MSKKVEVTENYNGIEDIEGVIKESIKVMMTLVTAATDSGIITTFELNADFMETLGTRDFMLLTKALDIVSNALDKIYTNNPDAVAYLATEKPQSENFGNELRDIPGGGI